MLKSWIENREEAESKSYKYSISYTSGATGFGWEEEAETVKDVELLIEDIRKNHTACVSVYDNQLKDFIFLKRALDIPETDLLHNYKRDLRTTTRKRKQS